MAERPVFIPKKGYVEQCLVEFDWHPGFAISQKKKNVMSLHQSAKDSLNLDTMLEISTKSESTLGKSLSAFNLTFDNGFFVSTVEAIYQGSKKFIGGGPFTDIYKYDSLRAKKDIRLKTSGDLVSFSYNDDEWYLSPLKGFYSWVYLKALSQNEMIFQELNKFHGFTDIEFNPKKSINCQAFCIAASIVLNEKGIFPEVLDDRDYFLEEIGLLDRERLL